MDRFLEVIWGLSCFDNFIYFIKSFENLLFSTFFFFTFKFYLFCLVLMWLHCKVVQGSQQYSWYFLNILMGAFLISEYITVTLEIWSVLYNFLRSPRGMTPRSIWDQLNYNSLYRSVIIFYNPFMCFRTLFVEFVHIYAL